MTKPHVLMIGCNHLNRAAKTSPFHALSLKLALLPLTLYGTRTTIIADEIEG